MNSGPLDFIPLWLFLPLSMIFCLGILEGGYLLGHWRHARAAGEKNEPVAAMAASILGLLAFILAFTFSMASTRFDARRQAVLEESNAIGTTYLRTRLLPEPLRSESAQLLRRYTEDRIKKLTPESIAELIPESEAIHEELWSRAVAASELDPRSVMTSLYLQSLNETIDMHARRVSAGLHSRIPLTIWVTLFSLTLLSMLSVGYMAGLSATRRSLEMPILVLAFSGVLYLIVDLDRAYEGLLRVNQTAMINLYETMQVDAK